MELATLIYNLTKEFPRDEVYGLSSQIKRAVIAIPSNIAEGQRRKGTKEFIQFLHISYGSGAELETQLELAKRLSFGNLNSYTVIENLLNEIMRMLNKLIYSLH